jgi:hypothetical protein
MRTKRTAIVLVTLALLSTSGCGKLREKLAGKAASEGSGGAVTISSGGATIATPNGTIQAAAGAKLPDGWPSSVPAYPGGAIQSSMGTPVGKTVVFTTSDSAQKVHDFYKSELKSMKLVTDIEANGAKVMAFKEGAKTVSVNIANATVTVSVAGF